MHSPHNSAIPLLGRFERNKNTCLHKYLYTDTYNHFIHNCPKLNPNAHQLSKVYTLWSQWNKKNKKQKTMQQH